MSKRRSGLNKPCCPYSIDKPPSAGEAQSATAAAVEAIRGKTLWPNPIAAYSRETVGFTEFAQIEQQLPISRRLGFERQAMEPARRVQHRREAERRLHPARPALRPRRLRAHARIACGPARTATATRPTPAASSAPGRAPRPAPPLRRGLRMGEACARPPTRCGGRSARRWRRRAEWSARAGRQRGGPGGSRPRRRSHRWSSVAVAGRRAPAAAGERLGRWPRVSFNASAQDPDGISAYWWSFGTSRAAPGADPVHTYRRPAPTAPPSGPPTRSAGPARVSLRWRFRGERRATGRGAARPPPEPARSTSRC